jgi:hypothetical protein
MPIFEDGRVLAELKRRRNQVATQPARQRDLSEQEEKRIAEEAKAIQKQETEPERQGDVLGLSDVSPDVEIPRATEDRSGNPAGIEVRAPTTGTSELRQTSGATGVQLGSAGSGTDLDSNEDKPAATRRDLND